MLSIGNPILGSCHVVTQERFCVLVFAIDGFSDWICICLHFTVLRLFSGRLCGTICVAIQTLAGGTVGGLEAIIAIGGRAGRISTIDNTSSILAGLWQEAIGGSVGLLGASHIRAVWEDTSIQAMARHAAADGTIGLCQACKAYHSVKQLSAICLTVSSRINGPAFMLSYLKKRRFSI